VSDYMTEVGGKVVCYRRKPMWTLADASNGKKLSEHLQRMEAKVARLKAEVERLKAEPDALTAYLYADTLRRDDIKTLKAHIERLTNAGDAMADCLLWDTFNQASKEWRAAKGVQS